MTGRAVLALDRVVLVLLALVLLVSGAAAAAWQLGRLDDVLPAGATAPDSLDPTVVLDPTGTSWWPWAAGLGGLVLVLLALRWLAAHVPQQRVSTMKLPGSSAQGRLEAEPGPVARAAADALTRAPGVRSARGTLHRERGVLTLVLVADVDPAALLPEVVTAAERATAEAATALGRDDVRARVRLRAAAGASRVARVD